MVLRLRRYERISIENRSKISGRRARPTNHSLSALSKSLFRFVTKHTFDRQTNGRPERQTGTNSVIETLAIYCRSGARSGSSGRAENRAERSGERALHKNDGPSEALSGRSRSGNGDGSRGYRNRLERGAAFSPLTCFDRKLICDRIFGYPSCV